MDLNPAASLTLADLKLGSRAKAPTLRFARRLGGLAVASSAVFLSTGPAMAALSVTASTDAAALAAALLGPGVNLVPGSAVYTGAANASGFFSGDITIFGSPTGTSGVLLTSGSVANALPPNNLGGSTANNGAPGSAYLSSLIGGATTLDASTLTFKVTINPGISALEWSYVYGSEEYLEFVESQFNDVFALSLDGTNLALIPGSTSTPVSINNVNPGTNSSFFRDNSIPGAIQTQYDGLTTVLKSVTPSLMPGVEYTLSFAIADVVDGSLDSGVFLKGGSITQTAPETDSVPGPLPLLGAAAAFGWSRRLRRRIRPSVSQNA